MTGLRHDLGSPLFRWGFTGAAALAATTGQWAPAAICGALTYLAWRTPRHRRKDRPR